MVNAIDRARDVIAENKKKIVEAELTRQEKEANNKENWQREHGFIGEIRPCFRKRMNSGEMCHQMRLALLLEAYWSGYKNIEDMVNLFKCFHDYQENLTRPQVEWFFKNKVPDIEKTKKWKPYRCTTIEDLNWCDKSECQIYNKRKEWKNEQKSEKK
jgi:hypothetical protein